MKQRFFIAAFLSAALLTAGTAASAISAAAEEEIPAAEAVTEAETAPVVIEAETAAPDVTLSPAAEVPVSQASGYTEIDPALLEYDINDQGIFIQKCDPSVSGKVAIPPVIDGIPVTRIIGNAFTQCTDITAIRIPDSVEYISGIDTFPLSLLETVDGIVYLDSWAVDADPGLTTASLREGTTHAMEYLFRDSYTTLEEVTVPDSFIGRGFLSDCYALKKLHLGAGVSFTNSSYSTYNGWLPYWQNYNGAVPKLEEITISKDNPSLISVDGVVYSKGLSVLYYFPRQKKVGKYEVPDTVKNIEYYAFTDCQLIEELSIPASLNESVSYLYLNNCTALKKLTIADGAKVTPILSYCTALEEVHLSDATPFLEWGAFRMCTSLKEIDIPASVMEISGLTFDNCSSLERVTFHGKLESISYRMFSYCDHLTEVNIPDGVKFIADGAFLDCEQLADLKLPDSVNQIGDWAFADCYSLGAMDIPEGVESIGWHTFHGCGDLSSLTLPSTLTSIGTYALVGCTSLKELTLPDGLETIGSWAFSMSGLHSLEIPASVRELRTNAFRDMVFLERVTIKAPLETIPFGSFDGDAGLETVILPDTVHSIGSYAFCGCQALKEFSFDGIDFIGGWAFCGTSLKSVTLPYTVREIGREAFRNCTALSEVNFSLNPAYTDGSDVPASNLTYIGEAAFFAAALDEVRIPASVTDLGVLCFGFGRYDADKPFVIYGADNSPAQQYAAIHAMKFVSTGETQTPVSDGGISVPVGGTVELTPPVSGKITWMSADAAIATVSSDGVVTGVSEGLTTVYAVSGGTLYPFQIVVGGGNAVLTTGDLNGDKDIDIIDVIFLNKFLLGVSSLTDSQKAAGDVDRNGDLDTNDSLILLKYVVELIDTLG